MKKKQYPSLEIFLPVLNVGPVETRKMKHQLRVNRIGEATLSEGMLNRLTKPSKAPQANLIMPVELVRLQGRAGVRKPTEAHTAELKEYLEETLPDSWRQWLIRTPTQPLRFDQVGSVETLSIAGCQQTLKARALIQRVLANFYGMEAPPRDIWMNNHRVARPVIARSDRSGASRELLHVLGYELELHNDDGSLLPHTTQLGGLVIEAAISPPASIS